MKPKVYRSTTLRFVLALTCAAGLTSIVHAQGVDASRQAEMRADLKKRFSAADTNADGKLSRDEAKRGMPRVYRSFDAIDTQKTGTLTLDQITAFAEKQGAGR